jgi:hypothetical protein
MSQPSTKISSHPTGLDAIRTLELDAEHNAILTQALADRGGSAPWRARKAVEARELLALSQIAPKDRMHVAQLDTSQSLRAVIAMDCPVALRSARDGQVVTHHGAVLGLMYPEEAMWRPQPGYAFVQVLSPMGLFHPNIPAEPPHIQPLCLGVTLPAGIRGIELILLAYAALTMQSIQPDERDAAGVMNLDAARFWQEQRHRLPLTRLSFLQREGAE